MPDAYENITMWQSTLCDNQDYILHEHDSITMNSSCMLSPYHSSTESQGTTTVPSPMSTSSSPVHIADYMMLNSVKVLGRPQIRIIEEPVEKFRFRYRSEMMGTHGSLLAASSSVSRKKHVPTVQLENFPERAMIRCTLVTSDELNRMPHAHRLVRREGNRDQDDPHHIEVSAENGFTASFHGMGIIHTAKKHIKDELIRKMRMEAQEKARQKNMNATLSMRDDAQIKADAELYQKHMNLNSVALCFQAFALNQNDVMIPITDPVYSHTINNLKSALTGELKICRIDKFTSTCEGGDEVFILVEKVGKKNIKVKFFELNEDDHEIWVDYGRFSELDVHHQYAIVFRTPPYKDLTITSPKEVFIQLERPSDADCSEPIKFTYKPSDRNMGNKRARMSTSTSSELSRVARLYSDTPVENATIFANSRELSEELKKMLSDECSSEEYRNYLTDSARYVMLLNNSEELACDGASVKKHQDDITFARNAVIEAVKIIKLDSKNMKENLIKLLKDRSTYGDSPLHSALRYGQWDIVKYILMLMGTDPLYKSLVNIQNSSGKTSLHYAVLQNQPEITKALLMLGADPNTCDDHGCSPLHAAVRIPEAGACVDALLSEKVTNSEAHNDAGWTALQLAAEAGSYHAVRSLVEAAVDVNDTDMSYGRTALHIAVEGGHKEIVEFLLKETNIDVNKRNFSGNTALHSAVVNTGIRAKELCKLLMQHGADPYIQNHNRESAEGNNVKEHNIDIKVEVDSDEENNTATAGQTSFDLASHKPDIMHLLKGQSKQSIMEQGTSIVETKQEIMDDELDGNTLTHEHKAPLSTILDKTGGWEKLAKFLKINYLIETFRQNSSSPTLLLLDYIEIQGISINEMKKMLQDLEETEAVEFLDNVSLLYQ